MKNKMKLTNQQARVLLEALQSTSKVNREVKQFLVYKLEEFISETNYDETPTYVSTRNR